MHDSLALALHRVRDTRYRRPDSSSQSHDVKQPRSSRSRGAFLRPGFFDFASLTPNRGVGGAPIRHPYILRSPQVAPDYSSDLGFASCATFTAPLRSPGYIVLNRGRSQGSSCAPGTSFPLPSYEAFVVRVATPMAATSICRWRTAAKAGSFNISVMAASAIWGW